MKSFLTTSFIHANLRSAQRGGTVRITAASSFSETLKTARDRITSIINSKLDDFFELSEYNWTPKSREESPSMYLYELVNWLTTVVDSLVIKDVYKDEAYQAAVNYIAECLSVSMLSIYQEFTQLGSYFTSRNLYSVKTCPY